MRIGIFLGSYTPETGGGFTFQESVLNALRAFEGPHELICFYYGGKEPIVSGGSLRWVRLIKTPNKPGERPLHEAVIAHHIEMVVFITPICEAVEVPYIYIVWDLQHRLQPYFPEVSVSGWTWDSRESFYQFVLPRAAYVITGTQAGKTEVMNFYLVPEDRIRVVPLPTPDDVLRSPSIANQPERMATIPPYLLYPAQFWPHKNHVALLLAQKILVEKEQMGFSVIFTGSDHGNLKYVRETVSELGLNNHVQFRGFVPRNELIHLYRNAFALVYPSFFGPDNIPPLEAFALGCPVIAARTSGSNEQMEDAAIQFDPKDEMQIVAAVKNLHASPELRNTLIQRGQTLARERTASGYVRTIFDIIEEFRAIRRCWSSRDLYKGI